MITGLGAVCALADDCPGLWSAIAAGRSGIAPIRRFATDGFSVTLGALVDRCAYEQPTDEGLTARLCRTFAEQALREALCSASAAGAIAGGARVALTFGTGIADLQSSIHEIAEELGEQCGLSGPRLTVSTACSSSTAAIGLGRDLLSMDAADLVIAGGSDVVTPEVFAGFHALGVLSPSKCAPFSVPAGTTLGEGGGFLVLERHESAVARGAPIVAELSGYGLAADAWHETSPDPKGAGVERAIRAALRDADVAADAIGYANVHGSGTEANDLSEWLGLQRALGAQGRALPVSSSKGALGHAQGAAGVLETVVTLLAMQRDAVPPTLHFAGARTQAPPDPVASTTPRPLRWEHALKLNAAFGGSNASLVLSRPRADRPAAARSRVCIVGVGEVGPGGLGPPAFRSTSHTHGRSVPPFEIANLLPGAETRGLDPSSRFLTAAAALALADAGVTVRGALREKSGLLVGQLRGSPASIVAFQRSIADRGLLNLSPSAFARIVLNAAAGFCSKLLSLRGPLSAVTTGAGSSLVATVLAAELVATRADVDLMVSGGCDEHHPDTDAALIREDEGAACLVLANERGVIAASAAPVWISGWGLAGPGQLDDAIAGATGESTIADAGMVFRAEEATAGDATGGAVALAAAVRALRDGTTTRALVTASSGKSMCAAIVLARAAEAA